MSCYSKQKGRSFYEITFYERIKEYECEETVEIYGLPDETKPMEIELETHKAITEKMKELGWLNE